MEELTVNEKSLYESLKVQDAEHRKLIRSLQQEINNYKYVNKQRKILEDFMQFYKCNIPICTQMSSKQIVSKYLKSLLWEKE